MRIKQNDTVPFQMQLKNDDGTAIDLSTASSVNFIMKEYSTDTAVIDSACSIVDATTGKVKYSWSDTETNTAGMYRIEFAINWAGGKVQTVPNDHEAFLWIISDLDGA